MKQIASVGLIIVIAIVLLCSLANAQWGEKWQNLGGDIIAIANADDDPQMEILTGYTDYSFKWTLRLLDGLTGIIEWEIHNWVSIEGFLDCPSECEVPFPPQLVDIDNDNRAEIIFYGRYLDDDTSKVHVYEYGGSGFVGDENTENHITKPSLSQNYPNPFNPSTKIEYSVQQAGKVNIKIYNMLGQEVRTLVDEEKQRGDYSVVWDGKNDNGEEVASGAYFYQLRVGDYVSSKKMIVLK